MSRLRDENIHSWTAWPRCCNNWSTHRKEKLVDLPGYKWCWINWHHPKRHWCLWSDGRENMLTSINHGVRIKKTSNCQLKLSMESIVMTSMSVWNIKSRLSAVSIGLFQNHPMGWTHGPNYTFLREYYLILLETNRCVLEPDQWSGQDPATGIREWWNQLQNGNQDQQGFVHLKLVDQS